MKILSVYPNHNSAVCLLDDGEVVLNWELERHSRIRHDYGYDKNFVELCLELSGWVIDDVDLLCINHDKSLAPRIERTRNGPPIDVPETTSQFVRGFETEFLGRRMSAYAVNHHVAHAASAYYTSPYDHASILTFDGGGDGMNISFSIGREGKIENLIAREVPYLALWWDGMSIGNFGCRPLHEMDPGSAAGKLMALAAFGTVDEALLHALVEEMEARKMDQHPVFAGQGIYAFDNFSDYSDTKTAGSQCLAKCLQSVTETDIEQYFGLAHSHGKGIGNLCYAGGVALNCVATSTAFERSKFQSIHVPPCPHDGGLALGMALFIYHDVLENPRGPKFFSPYTGPTWPAAELIAVLDAARVEGFNVHKIGAHDVGDMIVNGQIIGLFRGRSECGPRALGHRSIVCRPDLSGIQDRLNFLKNREWYRPFAPIVLDQFAGEILDATAAHSPYMSMAYDIAEAWHSRLEGVRHVDNSTRPQILTREIDPFLYAVIEQVYDKTEIPAILNTSFNNQEPIVETPGDAFATFLSTGMDALVLEDYAITRTVSP